MLSIRRRAAVVIAGAVLSLTATAIPAQAAIPAQDEIVMSPNITHLANIPKPEPFLSGLNSDIAFQGNYAFAGNYNGFRIYDIKNPRKPKVVSTVVCPGSQNDISVLGNLLFLSTDSARTNDSCQSQAGDVRVKESWEGMKIFDISDVTNPQYIKAVETDCGSHTHTLVPGKDGKDVYVYVSSYGPNDTFPDCRTPHDKISIIKVPLANPTAAAVTSTPVLFPDGGNPGTGGSFPDHYNRATSGCHDITAYPEKNIAAGACMGDGILMDISDPANPVVTEVVQDTANFAFWHSATFTNDGTKVMFTDELGGGSAPTCSEAIGPTRGANAYYDLAGGQLTFRSYFKIARHQAPTENCVAHNGSLIPVKGRDIMVQAWYQGGVSVVDFTDIANPQEIGFFERGTYSDRLQIAGSWSAYYYNGYIFSNDIEKGLDVLKLNDPRTNQANSVKLDILNTQTQGSYPEHGQGVPGGK